MQLSELAKGLVHLFYPAICEGCKKPLVAGERVLCVACESELPDTGYHHIKDNDTVQRFAGRLPIIYGSTFCWFTDEGLLQHLMHGLKYSGKKEIGVYMGELFGRRLAEAGWIKEVDIIMPVPLHPAKERKRGYNQALYIAKGISKATGIPVEEDVLIRNRKTESQTSKTRNERIDNMKGAFGINGKNILTGKHILLCDDVLTTGATLESCALALLGEESIKISMATIGIAVS